MLSSCQLMSAHVSSPAATAPWPADVSPRNSWHLCNILSWFLDTRYTSDLPWSKAHSELNQPMSENILRECRKRCPSPCSFAGHLFRCLRFEGCKPWWTNANFMHFKNLSVCHWLSNFDISVLFHSSFLHAWRHTAAPCELYWTGFLVTLGACSAGLQEHILAAGLSWGSAAISTPRSAIDYTCSTTWKRQKGSFRTGHCWSQTQKNAEFVEHISVRWWANLCSKYVVGYEAQEDIVTHTSLTKSEL